MSRPRRSIPLSPLKSAKRSAKPPCRAPAAYSGLRTTWVEVEAVCDRVLFLSKGKILLEGDPRQLPGVHGKETLEDLFIAVARESL